MITLAIDIMFAVDVYISHGNRSASSDHVLVRFGIILGFVGNGFRKK